MYQRAVVLCVPRHTRSAATAAKIQVSRGTPTHTQKFKDEQKPAVRQIPWSEADSAPEPGAFRHLPPRFTSGQRPVEPTERGRLRASTSAPEPQSNPRVVSRRPAPRFNESTSLRPPLTETSPPSRLSKLKLERASFRSGHAIARANNGGTTEIDRRRGKQKERDSGRRSHSKEVSTDLYIPSTVSVGQLAKLLNVRLRMVNVFPPYTMD